MEAFGIATYGDLISLGFFMLICFAGFGLWATSFSYMIGIKLKFATGALIGITIGLIIIWYFRGNGIELISSFLNKTI